MSTQYGDLFGSQAEMANFAYGEQGDREMIRHDRTGKVGRLLKDRERMAAAAEIAKSEVEAGKMKRRKLQMGTEGAAFDTSAADVLEEEFAKQTVGLTSKEEFLEKRKNIDEMIEKAQKAKNQEKVEKKMIVQKVKKAALSFIDDEDEEEEEDDESEENRITSGKNVKPGAAGATSSSSAVASSSSSAKKDNNSPPPFEAAESYGGSRPGYVFKLGELGLGYYADRLPPVGGGSSPGGKDTAGAATSKEQTFWRTKKNPTVDTSFLRDEAREKNLEQRKKQLALEYQQQQEKVKRELVDIVYSYWDGSGHRRSLQIEQGATIGQFLKVARLQLLEDFAALRHVASDELLYVKEDLILPHKVSFYELIRDQVRGKSGPLFSFDATETVTEAADIRVQRNDSHAGKIVQRAWYEQNKHVFPQKRWEIYDPQVSYGTYSVKGNANKYKRLHQDLVAPKSSSVIGSGAGIFSGGGTDSAANMNPKSSDAARMTN
ncbi:unnamed protein product [Amoebophrya sp. A120]|nr:unnamed protein product [Amoebophrya sp. A120]|eukprot:GSA120T00007709001.1